VRRTFEQGKNLLLQSSGLTEEAYGILKCVARYPAELVRKILFQNDIKLQPKLQDKSLDEWESHRLRLAEQ
jgi:hypothetical protein